MSIEIPHAAAQGGGGQLQMVLAADPEGKVVLDQTSLTVLAAAPGSRAARRWANCITLSLESGVTYFLRISVPAGQPQVILSRSVAIK